MIENPEMADYAAAGGALWLDENAPGWLDKIDLGTLDMWHNCILDQVYADRNPEGGSGFVWATKNIRSLQGMVLRLGFGGGKLLDQAWKKLVSGRREAAALEEPSEGHQCGLDDDCECDEYC